MLETKKSITITGHSVIDGKRAAEYRASIDETSPENMIMTNSQLDKEVYKENRVEKMLLSLKNWRTASRIR